MAMIHIPIRSAEAGPYPRVFARFTRLFRLFLGRIPYIFLSLCIASSAYAQWKFDWSTKQDYQGKPAGIFDTTPYPVSELTPTYSITTDEGTKTYTLGAIYFVDNTPGIVNGTNTYDPTTRANTGGVYTCYTSLVNALTANTSASAQNTTILVREGTYTYSGTYSITHHWGTDDTHRFSIIGYKQERPVLDGAGASTNMFGGGNSGDVRYQAYFTLQRLKLINRVGEAVYIGVDVVGTKRCQYVSLVDIWCYQCAYSGDAFVGNNLGAGTMVMTNSINPAWTPNQWVGYSIMNATAQAANRGTVYYAVITSNTDHTITTGTSLNWQNGDVFYVAKQVNGSVYYLNADYGWIYHCTLERSMGHGVKVGDGSSSMILEWNLVRDNGYWSGMPLLYHLSRTVGIDFPNDTGKDEMINNMARYNIVNGCGSHGFQVRGVKDIAIHHNDISNWGNIWKTTGYIGGITTAGFYVQSSNPTSGLFHSNIIHDASAFDTTGYMINDSRTSLSFNYYNNLIYGFNNGQYGIASYSVGGSSVFYNNTIEGASSAPLLALSRTTDIAINNIVIQDGAGKAATYGIGSTHTNNLYYAPGGSLGVTLGSGELVGAPVFKAVGDFHLHSLSPAVEQGSVLSIYFDYDLDGNLRIAPWDIGALKHIPTIPVVVTQPVDKSSAFGTTVTFSILTRAQAGYTIRWSKDGVPLSDSAHITGSDGSSLTISNLTFGDAGAYRATVTTSSYGSITSSPATLTVVKADPTITAVPTTSNITYGQTLSLSALSGGTASVPGVFSFKTPASVINAGVAQTVDLTFTPSDTTNYNTVFCTSVITIAKATPTVTWTAPPAIAYGTVLSGAQLSATSDAPGSFAYTPAPGATLAAGADQILSAIFHPTNPTNYNTVSTSTTITVTKATPIISWSTPAPITYSASLSSTQYNATTTIPGSFLYTPTLGTILNAGSDQILSVTFSPTDSSNYNSASKTTTITVNKANQTITFDALADRTLGNLPFTLAATSNSGLSVSYVSSTPSVASLIGSTVTIAGLGSTTITASQSGDSNYLPALDVSRSLNVIAPTAAPVVTSPLSITGIVASSFSYSIAATNYPTSFSTVGLPSGLSLDVNTGVISGVPALPGTTNVTIKATNMVGTGIATLTINVTEGSSAPIFTTQPVSQSISIGSDVIFTVYASGAPTPSIQWTKNGADILGANSTSLRLNSITSADAGTYAAVATNSSGTAKSYDADLAVTPLNSAPTITSQPASLSAIVGGNVAFSVGASGYPPPTCQWRKNDINIINATDFSLALIGVTDADAGKYSVTVHNSSGSVTSDYAVLTIIPAGSAPVVTVGPVSQSVTLGTNVTFTVTASGVPAPSFQWRKDGILLNGQHTTTLILNNVQQSDAGSYDVIVSNTIGNVISSSARLVVSAPQYTGQYFGNFSDGGFWALNVRADNSATYIAYLPGRHSTIVVDLMIAGDGSFSVVGSEYVTAPAASDRSIVSDRLDSYSPGKTTANAVGTSFTLTGAISNGVLTGDLSGIGQTLSGSVAPISGPAQAIAGLYTAVALNGANGITYSIVGATGQIVAITISSSVSDGSIGTTDASGKLATTTVNGASLSLFLNSQSHSISVSYQPTGSTTAILFEGTSVDAVASSHLAAVSMRANVGNGDQTLIVGFVIGGAGTKRMLIRGVGPTLSQLGVTNALPDPYLKLFNASLVQINSNDNWGGSTELSGVFSQVSTFPLPATSKDAVLLPTLPAGPASAHVTATSGAGIALAEFYDADSSLSTTRLSAVSGRAQSGLGDDLLMLGFVITGNTPMKVLIRGIGPTLTQYQISAVLDDPKLEVFDSSNRLIVSNDNWGGSSALSDAFALVHAAALPANSKDSALIVTLQPGVYYAHVRGVGNTTGVALVEVFEIP